MDPRVNTKFFLLSASARRRKNFIPSLAESDRTLTAHEDKAAALHNFYLHLFGTPPPQNCTLN
jgi:hypothetical protein